MTLDDFIALATKIGFFALAERLGFQVIIKKKTEGWQDENRTTIEVERVYDTRYDCSIAAE